MKKIGIVILNYNGEKDTIKCLGSLLNLRLSDYNILITVVDNASPNGNFVYVKDYVSDLKRKNVLKGSNIEIVLVENSSNLGFAGGNNSGIRYVLKQGADYVIILNNDTIVDSDFVAHMSETAKSHHHEGILVPKIFFSAGNEFHKNRYKESELGKVIWYAGGIMDWKNVIASHRGVDEVDRGQFGKPSYTDFASGCCMMVSKKVFESIGFFDERYFLYYEDSDFSERAKKAGFKILFVPESILWHNNAASTGGSGSKLQDYYITRNRLLFGFRHARLRSKLALFKQSIKLLFSGRKYQRIGAMDYYMGRFGKGSYHA